MDWRDMEAGIALDKIIAERLGWTGIQNVGGELYGHFKTPLGSVMEAIPHYSTDLNAAFALPLETHWYMSLTIEDYKGKRAASIACVPRDNRGIYPVSSGSWGVLARNYCRAWLEYREIAANE